MKSKTIKARWLFTLPPEMFGWYEIINKMIENKLIIFGLAFITMLSFGAFLLYGIDFIKSIIFK
jgi:hypothetical protein